MQTLPPCLYKRRKAWSTKEPPTTQSTTRIRSQMTAACNFFLSKPNFNSLTWSFPLIYGVRSPQKFIVWILNSSFKFHFNFIAEFKILHSSFRFRIIGKRFDTRLLFFKLNSFIWPCSTYSLNSLHQIKLAESYFKLDLENFQHDFWIFGHASVIVAQHNLSGDSRDCTCLTNIRAKHEGVGIVLA